MLLAADTSAIEGEFFGRFLALVWAIWVFQAIFVLPAMRRGSRRSFWYGIHLVSTLSSEKAWRAGHKAAKGPLIGGLIFFPSVSLIGLIPSMSRAAALRFEVVLLFASAAYVGFIALMAVQAAYPLLRTDRLRQAREDRRQRAESLRRKQEDAERRKRVWAEQNQAPRDGGDPNQGYV